MLAVGCRTMVRARTFGYFADPEMVDIYNRMLKETTSPKPDTLMRQFDTRINQQAHQLMVTTGTASAHAIVREGMENLAEPLSEQDSRISGWTSMFRYILKRVLLVIPTLAGRSRAGVRADAADPGRCLHRAPWIEWRHLRSQGPSRCVIPSWA